MQTEFPKSGIFPWSEMHTPAEEIRFPLKQSQICNQDIVVPSNDKSLASENKN